MIRGCRTTHRGVLYALGTLSVLKKAAAANEGVKITAFADDIFIAGETEAQVQAAIDFIARELRLLGVELNLSKTKIVGRDGDPDGLTMVRADLLV